VRNEEEKVSILTQEVDRLEQELLRSRSEELPGSSRTKQQEPPVKERDVKESREYQMLLKDLQLLLSHRDEITDMKQLVVKLQQNV